MTEFKAICKNPWCKSTFLYTENDIIDDCAPKHCKKCDGFNNNLSAGVTWEEREYEGGRNDFMSHEIKYKVTNYKL